MRLSNARHSRDKLPPTYGMYEDTFRNASPGQGATGDQARASDDKAPPGLMSFAQGSRRDSEMEPFGRNRSDEEAKRKANLAALNVEYLEQANHLIEMLKISAKTKVLSNQITTYVKRHETFVSGQQMTMVLQGYQKLLTYIRKNGGDINPSISASVVSMDERSLYDHVDSDQIEMQIGVIIVLVESILQEMDALNQSKCDTSRASVASAAPVGGSPSIVRLKRVKNIQNQLRTADGPDRKSIIPQQQDTQRR